VRHGEFLDRRLVSVYDAECLWSRDDEFFISVANETPAVRVLDLGCGTGRLTIALAKSGHAVVGVDPARASLEAARRKPGAELVTWIEGTSAILPDASFDVAVMTSHVAQFFVSDDEWIRTLADLRRSLVPAGRLVFDTRDPRGHAWERWNPQDSKHEVVLSDGSIVEVWTEVNAVQDGAVSFTHHYVFAEGPELLSTATLRFRDEHEVRASLRDAGFVLEQMYGGWNHEPVGEGDGEFLVIARTQPISRWAAR
jgi:ubiquinone/menaquinone biosynthesis C-methylase UbiE